LKKPLGWDVTVTAPLTEPYTSTQLPSEPSKRSQP